MVVRERKNYKGENIRLEEWKIRIQESFPFMEQDPSDNGNIYHKYGFEFAGGWYDILRECLETIVARYAEDGIGLSDIDFIPCQLKEKFGAFRFYYDYTDVHCVNAALDFIGSGLTMRFEPDANGEVDEAKMKRRKDIRAIVSAAEQKSKCTCEMCGAEGKLRDDSDIGIHWVKTLCDSCHEKRIAKYGEAKNNGTE